MSDTIQPPWTAEQVANLMHYQLSGVMHPFTCGNRDAPGHLDDDVLIPTPNGWRCLHCDYRQDWAWAFMATPLPRFDWPFSAN